MIKVIGIRFRTAGKIYFFDPLDFEIKRGDHVIVETARGIEFGTAVSAPNEVEDEKVIQPLKPVLRIASEKDVEQEAANKIKEKEAFKICLEKIRKHGLEMKLIDAEYTFDNNKVLFYFTADGRIDFRELVKDLAGVFKTRIELRQIGVRDETKIVGGIGTCGRPLCCHTHLPEFIPVSIKMAKEQNLSLNPTKISGVCGRLMCCLKHEEETYEELNRRLPGVGDYVTTEDGLRGEVQSVNVLRQLVKVIVDVNDEKEIHEYKVEDLHFKRKHSKKERLELSPEELKELEKLEAEELLEGADDKPVRKEEHTARRENRQDKTSMQNKTGTQDRKRDRREGRPEREDEQEGRQQDRKGNRRGRYGRRDNRFEEGDERQRDNRQEEGGERQRDNRPSEGGEHQRDNRSSEGGERQGDNRQEEGGERQRGNRHHEGGEYRRDNRQGQRRNDNRSRNRQNYRGGNREGKSNFESNQSEGK